MGNLVLLDYRTGEDVVAALKSLGIEGLRGPKCSTLPWQTDGHPDLFFHKVNDEVGVAAPEVYGQLLSLFCRHGGQLKGLVLLKGQSGLGREYPWDVRYNFLRLGNKVFGRLDMMDQRLRQELERHGVELVHVKQGYARCSVAVVSETSCITSDKGLASTLRENGLTVLEIEAGGVLLEGYDHGFIGGASGLVGNDFLLTGRYADHEVCRKLEDFVAAQGKRLRYLSEGLIRDIGSIIPI